ncbi:MAG: zinc ribbon domain-containing protein [Gallionella sp.]|nr:zinc ribbon domain-containing protein [Gallionella sp.]
MYCMKCGAEIAAETKFCGKCGASQTVAESPAVASNVNDGKPTPKQNVSGVAKVAAAVIVWTLLAGMAFFIYLIASCSSAVSKSSSAVSKSNEDRKALLSVGDARNALADSTFDFHDKSAVNSGGPTIVWRLIVNKDVTSCRILRRFITDDDNAWKEHSIGAATLEKQKYRDTGEVFIALFCKPGMSRFPITVDSRIRLSTRLYDEQLYVTGNRVGE